MLRPQQMKGHNLSWKTAFVNAAGEKLPGAEGCNTEGCTIACSVLPWALRLPLFRWRFAFRLSVGASPFVAGRNHVSDGIEARHHLFVTGQAFVGIRIVLVLVLSEAVLVLGLLVAIA